MFGKTQQQSEKVLFLQEINVAANTFVSKTTNTTSKWCTTVDTNPKERTARPKHTENKTKTLQVIVAVWGPRGTDKIYY